MKKLDWKRKLSVFRLCLLILGTILQSSHTVSQVEQFAFEVIYGPEWTFFKKSDDLAHIVFPKLKQAIANEAKKKFKGQVAVESNWPLTTIEVRIGNEMTIYINEDLGVYEVQAVPKNLHSWKKYQSVIEDLVFNVMKASGYYPHEREGAGHINIGIKSGTNRNKFIIDFVLDFLSQPGVGLILNSETANGEDAQNIYDFLMWELGITDRRSSQLRADDLSDSRFRSAFEGIISGAQTLDESKVIDLKSTQWLLFRYLTEKYVAVGLRESITINPGKKTLRFTPDNERSRIEVRQVKPQQNMRQFVLLLELFEARLRYLHQVGFDRKKFNPTIIRDGWDALKQFANYVEDSGLNFDDYKQFLPEIWQELDERLYVKSRQNKTNRVGQCLSLF